MARSDHRLISEGLYYVRERIACTVLGRNPYFAGGPGNAAKSRRVPVGNGEAGGHRTNKEDSISSAWLHALRFPSPNPTEDLPLSWRTWIALLRKYDARECGERGNGLWLLAIAGRTECNSERDYRPNANNATKRTSVNSSQRQQASLFC